MPTARVHSVLRAAHSAHFGWDGGSVGEDEGGPWTYVRIADHHGRRRQLRDLWGRRLCLAVGRAYRCRGPSIIVEERRVDVVVHGVSVHAHLVIEQGEVRHVRPEGFGVGSVNIKEDAQLVLWTSGSQREGLVDTEDLRRLSPTRVWRYGEHLARRQWLACLGSATPRL